MKKSKLKKKLKKAHKEWTALEVESTCLEWRLRSCIERLEIALVLFRNRVKEPDPEFDPDHCLKELGIEA